MTPTIGQTVSHYKILGHVGSGGMGMVFKATDLRLDRTVALKFLPPELTRDQDAKQRLIREARASSSIQHKNICVIHDIDEDDDAQLFISMEFLEGDTLKKRIDAGPLAVDEALHVAAQIAEGLARAHSAGIVHRDLKPANIILTREGLAKILDFGMATTAAGAMLTRSGATVGTASYMSPEQARGGTVDHRTDIWSLGVLLYEMLTGRRPFESEYDQGALYAVVNEKPRVPSELRPEIPVSVERLINRCLEKDPAARIQNAEAFLEEERQVNLKPPRKKDGAQKAVAVLPFSDISPEKDNKYFSDGLTEEIIDKLSKLRTIRIIPRTSVMSYDRAGKPLDQIAAELGAQYLLEGGVRKHGANLRITTRLIDAHQDAYLWTETYDGTMDQVFEIQENVAARIVKALKVRLSPDEKRNLKRRATKNTEAYQLYLQGRSYWNTRSAEGLRKAIEYFEKAIEKDPRYAGAWAGLADAYSLMSDFTGVTRKETYPQARAAVMKALEYDDQLAEPHASLAMLLMLNEWDWPAAEKEFNIAFKLNPNYATAHHWYAECAAMNGEITEALASISRAAELDPHSPAIIKDKGMIMYYARDFDGAIEHARTTLAMDPNFSNAYRLLALAFQAKGMFPEAIANQQRWGDQAGKTDDALASIAQCHAASGDREEALRIIKNLETKVLPDGNLCRGIALAYAALGDKDAAFQWLEKGYARHAEALLTIRVDPKTDPLRGDQRYDALVTKMGLGKKKT